MVISLYTFGHFIVVDSINKDNSSVQTAQISCFMIQGAIYFESMRAIF